MHIKLSDIERIPMSVLIEKTAKDTGRSATEIHLIVKQLIGNITDYVVDGYAVSLDSLATFYPDVVHYGEPTTVAKVSVSKVLSKKCTDTTIKLKKDNYDLSDFEDIIL